MEPGGDSESWLKSTKNMLRIFEVWRQGHEKHTELCPVEWQKLAAAQLTNRNMWGSLATYLVSHYVSSQGKNKGFPLDLAPRFRSGRAS